ncbi:MAG TPA: AI-2E family transporter [bacterium]
MEQRGIISAIFLVTFALVIYVLIIILKPFFIPLFWAILIVIVIYPLYGFTKRMVKGKASLVALLYTFFVSFVIIIPAVLVIFLLASETVDAFNRYKEPLLKINVVQMVEKIKDTHIGKIIGKFSQSASIEKTEGFLVGAAEGTSKFILTQAQSFFKHSGIFLFKFIITLISVFFFLRDGEKIVSSVKRILPLPEEKKEHLLFSLQETLSAVVNGMILTAVVQGLLLAIGFWIFGMPYPVIFGVTTVFTALLPFAGAAIIWIPAAIYLFWLGSIGKAIGLIIWGVLLVSSIDNFLKPILIGEKTKLPFLFLFLSILGGMKIFGITGIFLGPAFLALFIALTRIYLEEYQQRST